MLTDRQIEAKQFGKYIMAGEDVMINGNFKMCISLHQPPYWMTLAEAKRFSSQLIKAIEYAERSRR